MGYVLMRIKTNFVQESKQYIAGKCNVPEWAIKCYIKGDTFNLSFYSSNPDWVLSSKQIPKLEFFEVVEWTVEII